MINTNEKTRQRIVANSQYSGTVIRIIAAAQKTPIVNPVQVMQVNVNKGQSLLNKINNDNIGKTRKNWDKAFQKMRINNDDALLFNDNKDDFDWEWQ